MTAPLSRSQRAADAITEFCGSWTFIAAFSALTVGWIALNTILVLVGHFDPYPFILFNLVLTVVSTFQSPLIMMSQNRQIERDRITLQDLHDKFDEQAQKLDMILMVSQSSGWLREKIAASGMTPNEFARAFNAADLPERLKQARAAKASPPSR